MKDDVIRAIRKERIIVILRGIEDEKILPVAEALYNGGIRLLEITYNAAKSELDGNTSNSIKKLADYFADKMFIGAGTVLTEEQVRLTKRAGGRFIISPNTDQRVIAETAQQELVSIPGALTPSEIVEAHKCGADFVKLFPVISLGTEYVKAVKVPLSHIELLAVGGIDEKNMKEYLKAGVSGFGIGSNILNRRLVAEGDYMGITRLAAAYTAVIDHV